MAGAALSAIVSLLLLVPAVSSAAAPPTRAEYVTALEQTCRPDAEATSRAVKGVTADIRAERLRLAATKFSTAARIFGGTVDQIGAIPRPLSDAAKLSKWFGYLGEEERYLLKVAAALRAGHTIASQRYTARFVHNGNLANNTVLAFGFDYCLFKISRFR